MTLYLIGIGLHNYNDITKKGIDAIRKSQKVYLENYTSLLQCSKEDLEKAYGTTIHLANRQQIENNQHQMIEEAKNQNIAILIIGSPLAATTHITYLTEAKKHNINIEIIHNASILTAVGSIGLELYKYGTTTSIPYAESNTPNRVIENNRKNNQHTLCLLDLHPEKNEFLTIPQAIKKLRVLPSKIVACARIGCPDQTIKVATPEELKLIDFGKPPYCIVVPAPKLHFVEEEALRLWM